MKRGIRPFFFALASCAVIAFLFPAVSRAEVRIGGWALTGNGQLLRGFEYSGSCPVDLKFDWGVISTEPATINYTYSRSDGGRPTSTSTMNHPGGGRSVPITLDWRLGANSAQFSDFKGWMQLDIEGPSRVSRRIDFTLHCGSAVPAAAIRVGGQSLRANGQVAQGFQYSGSCPVQLQFGWGIVSSNPDTISYTFRRNDGGHTTNVQTAQLRGGNQSTPIYDEWRLGANNAQFANYAGWVELDIESPTRLESKIGFTIHCQ